MTGRRGLVLGGGGVLGAAWMVGALSVLEDELGADLRDFDQLVGTLAGSVLAALLGAGVSVADLRRHQLGESLDEGPLAGFHWDYENATGGDLPSRPRVRMGSGGLLVLPYFAGERSPVFDPQARGVVAGLTLSHTRAHLYRAVYEGVAYGVRQLVELLAEVGSPVGRLVAVGGGTRTGLWPQVVSDVTGLAQQWAQDSTTNGGLTLVSGGAPVRFASPQGAGGDAPALAPYLDVTYAPAASPPAAYSAVSTVPALEI